jgi:hypothetical protein
MGKIKRLDGEESSSYTPLRLSVTCGVVCVVCAIGVYLLPLYIETATCVYSCMFWRRPRVVVAELHQHARAAGNELHPQLLRQRQHRRALRPRLQP